MPTPSHEAAVFGFGSGAGASSPSASETPSPLLPLLLSPTTNFLVGNTPSSVLFFVALAVGVVIAAFFAYFTVRYFVRSRYGLNVYLLSGGRTFREFGQDAPAPQDTADDAMVLTRASDIQLREQLEFVRLHAPLRYELVQFRMREYREGRQYIVTDADGVRRRRRHRGRFSKMKKLTQDQVDILFPRRAFKDWLNGGKEVDEAHHDNLVHESGPVADAAGGALGQPVEVLSAVEMVKRTETIELLDLSTSPSRGSRRDNELVDLLQAHRCLTGHYDHPEEQQLSDDSNLEKEPVLQFLTGSCAICLDTFEDSDIVRGLVCGHVFHAECLDPWLTKRRACCPMCKRDYLYKDPALAQAEHDAHISGQTAQEQVPSDSPGDAEDASTSEYLDLSDWLASDFDTLRADYELVMLLHQIAPAHERVRVIIADETLSPLNIEARAQDWAKRKYGKFPKILWWKIMGVSFQDLFDFAALELYRKRPATASSQLNSTNEHAINTTTGAVAENAVPRASAESLRETVERLV